jgi:hypothetical protein
LLPYLAKPLVHLLSYLLLAQFVQIFCFPCPHASELIYLLSVFGCLGPGRTNFPLELLDRLHMITHHLCRLLLVLYELNPIKQTAK